MSRMLDSIIIKKGKMLPSIMLEFENEGRSWRM